MPDLTPDQIKRALLGDEALMRQLVDTLTPVIQASAARALLRRSGAAGNRDVAQEVEDLIQSVLTTLCTSGKAALLRWDPERGSLKTYIRRVAEREISSILRSMRQNPWTEDPTPDESLDQRATLALDPERDVGARELLLSVLRRLREKISDQGREIFDLLVIDGRSAEDVCAIMNMKPDAVYAWRSRLARMARDIAEELLSERQK